MKRRGQVTRILSPNPQHVIDVKSVQRFTQAVEKEAIYNPERNAVYQAFKKEMNAAKKGTM